MVRTQHDGGNLIMLAIKIWKKTQQLFSKNKSYEF